MNSSLSTVDSLFSATPNPINSRHQNREECSDKVRSSPSFNDSEPPSYFEAIGISQNQIILNTDGLNFDSTHTSRLSSIQQQQRLPKISMDTSPEAYSKEYSNLSTSQTMSFYHHQHSHPRIHNLPLSITQQNIQATRSYSNNSNLGNINSFDSIQKPSETYLVWSIFTTIYCVFIGVPALVLSIKVYHYNKQEEYQKAYSRSKIARYFNIAGLFFGIVYMTIGIIACLLPRR